QVGGAGRTELADHTDAVLHRRLDPVAVNARVVEESRTEDDPHHVASGVVAGPVLFGERLDQFVARLGRFVDQPAVELAAEMPRGGRVFEDDSQDVGSLPGAALAEECLFARVPPRGVVPINAGWGA